jgi:hypothetical protein
MADVKISALPTTTTTAAGDVYPLVQGGVTKHIDFDDIVDSIPDASATVRGVVTTGTQTLAGNKTLQGDSPTVGNALVVQNSTPTAKLTVANAGRVTVGQDSTVTTEVCAVITTDVTNANLVIAPNGTGAIIADIPDGTAAGGNARGDNAIDLQSTRTANTQVASGAGAILLGRNSTASGNNSVMIGIGTSTGLASVAIGGNAVGGQNANATSNAAIAIGTSSTASGANSTAINGGSATATGAVAIGENTSATSSYAFSTGYQSIASLYGQLAKGAGRFAGNSDAQTSNLTFRNSITGTAITELFLNGANAQANLALPTGATNARAWRAQIDLVAICATAGGGGAVQNDCFMGSYHAGIKRVGATTSLVGAVSVTNEVSDASMSTSVVTIDADDTNEALRIQFTPPSTADGTTVIRVVATAYLTEVGR